MPKEYSQKELWNLYEKLPKELQEAIFSVETAKHMKAICQKNEIDNQASEIAKRVGDVLLGLLPPDEFQEYLEQEFDKEKAKRISHEINRFVFFPIKHSLAELYKPATETKPTKKADSQAPTPKEDAYREPIE